MGQNSLYFVCFLDSKHSAFLVFTVHPCFSEHMSENEHSKLMKYYLVLQCICGCEGCPVFDTQRIYKAAIAGSGQSFDYLSVLPFGLVNGLSPKVLLVRAMQLRQK